jgi:hypothetical protein
MHWNIVAMILMEAHVEHEAPEEQVAHVEHEAPEEDDSEEEEGAG